MSWIKVEVVLLYAKQMKDIELKMEQEEKNKVRLSGSSPL